MSLDQPVQADNRPTSEPRRQIPHETIAARAEKLWHERNCPAGRDEAIWFEAESQLQAEAEAKPVSGTPSRPYVDEPAQPIRPRTKTQDPTDSAVQTRSGTEPKSRRGSEKIRSQ